MFSNKEASVAGSLDRKHLIQDLLCLHKLPVVSMRKQIYPKILNIT